MSTKLSNFPCFKSDPFVLLLRFDSLQTDLNPVVLDEKDPKIVKLTWVFVVVVIDSTSLLEIVLILVLKLGFGCLVQRNGYVLCAGLGVGLCDIWFGIDEFFLCRGVLRRVDCVCWCVANPIGCVAVFDLREVVCWFMSGVKLRMLTVCRFCDEWLGCVLSVPPLFDAVPCLIVQDWDPFGLADRRG